MEQDDIMVADSGENHCGEFVNSREGAWTTYRERTVSRCGWSLGNTWLA